MSDPTLSLTTDKPLYNVGDPIVVTALYTDSQVVSETVTISGTATDSAGNTISATTTVTVNTSTPEHMDVVVTDNDNRTYTLTADQPGQATLQATA
jgi:uncharacterized protein YaiE (UPF0345 family)